MRSCESREWGPGELSSGIGPVRFAGNNIPISKYEAKLLDKEFGETVTRRCPKPQGETEKSNLTTTAKKSGRLSWLKRILQFLMPSCLNKKSTSAFIAFVAFCAFNVHAANYKTEVVNGITWKYTNPSSSTSAIYGYQADNGSGYETAIPTGTSGDIVIPSTLGGKPVTQISGYAFQYCSKITSVVIPDTVTYVGRFAFQRCSELEKIVVGKSVSSVGRYAFSTRQLYSDSSSLKTIIIRGGKITGETNFYITDRREGVTVYVNSGRWSLPATWEGYSVKAYDPMPEIGSAVSKNLNEALYFANDSKLKSNVNTTEKYNAFRLWANGICGTSDMKKRQSVMDSSLAWFSYAINADKLITTAPKQGDLRIDDFKSNETSSDAFDFELSVEGIPIGDGATASNLAKVFCVEGATTANGEFSADSVELSFGTPVDGKVTCTARPKDTTATSFFMKANMNP